MGYSKKFSKIWNISSIDLQNIVDTSSSIKEILIKLGYKSFSANRKTLELRFLEKDISLDLFNENKMELKNKIIENLKNTNSRLTEKDLLVENCKHGRHIVKKFIIKNKIINYECESCGNKGQWNGSKLILQLEHKNGINNDNRKENLCFLCPNCHTQTLTWGKRNNKTNNTLQRKKKFETTKEELEKLVHTMPITKIGEIFNVTGNSIRKRCVSLEIKIPKYPPGYWIKNIVDNR